MNPRNTRSAILDMAVKLFNQHGSQSVSTNRIAAEMGLSVGNLYYHYWAFRGFVRSEWGDLVD